MPVERPPDESSLTEMLDPFIPRCGGTICSIGSIPHASAGRANLALPKLATFGIYIFCARLRCFRRGSSLQVPCRMFCRA